MKRGMKWSHASHCPGKHILFQSRSTAISWRSCARCGLAACSLQSCWIATTYGFSGGLATNTSVASYPRSKAARSLAYFRSAGMLFLRSSMGRKQQTTETTPNQADVVAAVDRLTEEVRLLS